VRPSWLVVSSKRRNLLVGAVVAAITIFAFLTFFYERRREEQSLRADLEIQAAVRAQKILKEIEEYLETLAFLADWYRIELQSGRETAAPTLITLSRVLLARNPDLYLLAEARPSDPRPGEAPAFSVAWVEPREVRPLVVGSDLHRHPIFGPLLARAIRTGRLEVSSRVPCPDKEDENDGGYDVWLLQPLLPHVYEGGIPAEGAAPVGMLIAVLDIQDIMERSLSEMHPADLAWRLTDQSARPGEETLYASGRITAPGGAVPAWQTSFPLTARIAWTLSATPGPAFITSRLRRQSWWLLAGGLSFALLVGGLLVVLANQTQLVESQVRDRTESLSREIAERLQAESRLRESEGKYRALAENAEDLIYVAGLDLRLTYTNSYAARRAGVRPEELIGAPVTAFAPELSDEESVELMSHIVAGRAVQRAFQVVLQGKRYWYDINLVPLKNDAQQVTGVLGIGRDITTRKELEAQLQKAKEAAEAAAAAKGEFLATMSHEIRTPLNGVIGTIGLLLDGPLSERQRELGDIAHESANILLALINDILDFSKIEAQRLEIEPIPFDLPHVLEEVAALYAASAAGKGLELVVSEAADVPRRVIGDAGRIRQVLLNLVGNAVKFTERGHILLGVASEGLTDGAVGLRFFVEDTGCGITGEQQQRLFERFVQGDASTTRRHGGTGLGLAISRKLVELMGGRIGVESRAGDGAVFWFRLALPPDPHPPALPPAPADLAGLRTLVVDDHEINRRVLREILSGRGLRTAVASGGEEALALLQRAAADGDPFRIAILDYLMPGMDGLSLARAIKAEPALQPTLLVMATSFDQRGDAERMREAGVALYLVKPLRPTQLHELLAAAWALHLQGRDTALLTRHDLAGVEGALRSPATLRRCRILVVEDNAINQRVAVLALESLGCRADLAANGAEAVAMAQRLPYDLVLMDCEMPEMDGFEAARAIRRGEAGGERRLPIVAMTARAGQGDRERCLQSGMDDFLSKPVSPQQIAGVLARFVPLRGGVPDDRAAAAPAPRGGVSLPGGPPPALDPRKAAELRRLCGGRDRWEQFAALFESGVGALLPRLRDGCAAGDADEVRAAAHKLKGSCANLGAQAMVEWCARLDECARGPSLEGAAGLLAALETEWGRVRSALEEQRRQWAAGDFDPAASQAAQRRAPRGEGGA
jgi:PAS domain S-box-containing protein